MPGSVPTFGAKQPSADLEPGTVVGDYAVEKKIGRGGMGGVYEARHRVIGKRVAIKVLHHEMCDRAAVARFVQEARAVNHIRHPSIVDVFGFGTTDDGRAFLAMELLEGETLGARMSERRLDRREACEILAEVTHPLEAAHRAGIVHRDLKPDNIFLVSTEPGRVVVKLLDFGIAKLMTMGGFDEPVDCTQPGTLVGTPQYMAPEQARGQALDGSADVYALGVVAFELLVGRPPFTSRDPVELLAKHITLAPPAPSELDPMLPGLADDLVGAMLAKDPAMRPPLSDVRMKLVALRTAKAGTANALARSRLQATEIHDAIDDTVPAPHRRRRGLWIGGTAIGTLAIAAVIVTAISRRSTSDPSPRPAPPTPMTVIAPVTAPITPPPATSPTATTTPAEPTLPATPKHAKHTKRVVIKPKPEPAKPEVTKPEITKPEVKPATPPPAPPDDDALRSPFDRKKP